MNISVYLNDGEVISSVDINEATVEEALSAIRAFDFGENEDSDKIRIKDLTCEVSALKDALNDVQEECDCWKENYKIECQHNDDIKKSYDKLTEDFNVLFRDRDEWRDKYAAEWRNNDNLKKAFKDLENSSSDLLKQLEEYEQIASDRDEWRDKCNMLEKCYKSASTRCVELLKERDEYKEIASDRDDLKIENDKLKELCEMLQNEKDELERRFKLVREDYFDMQHQVYKLMVEKDKLEKEYEKLMKDREDYLCQLKKSES